jgi:hypothetical protein
MAAYPPLIIKAGEFQRLPAADSIFERLTFRFDGGSMLGYGQTLSYMDDVAKTFQVLSIASVLSNPIRLRLYSSQAARDADASRDVTTPPPAQTEHGVIMDVFLTATTGYAWTMSPVAPGSTEAGTARVYFIIDNGDALALNPRMDVTILRFE